VANFSYSKLESFKRCPFQYKLTYIERVPSREMSIEAFVGICFHELMEQIFAEGKERDYFLEELFERYEALWKKKWTEDVVTPAGEKTTDDFLEYGKQCIRNFYETNLGPAAGFSAKTIGVETKINFPIDEKNKMIGYIDRIAEKPDGSIEIQDYKTGSSLPKEEDLLKDRQLSFYQLGVEEMRRQEGKASVPIEFVWHYVGHAKTIRLPQKTREELDVMLSDIREEIEVIVHEREFAAKLNPMCRYCKYQKICPEYQRSKGVVGSGQ